MEIRFHQPEMLHLLWIVAALVVLLIVADLRKRQAVRQFADQSLLPRLFGAVRFGAQRLRIVLIVFALLAIVLGLLDPRWGVTYREVRQQGIDVFFVLDVSRSMLAEDVRPNRLERAQQYIHDMLPELAGDRVGLITFAGAATVKVPLTIDHNALRVTLDTITPQSAPRGGSALGSALLTAADAFTDDLAEHKAIVLISDGEDLGSDPLQAAEHIAEERGIPVITIGIGDPAEGARIPLEVHRQRVYLTYEGQQVWSKMNPEMLRQIALTTGGAYIPAATAWVDMSQIARQHIEPLARREIDVTQTRRYIPRFQWFAGAALVLLMIEMFISECRSKHGRVA